jgi:hypothetical protein
MSVSATDQPLIVCDATGDDCDALERRLGVVAGRPSFDTFNATLSPDALNGTAAGLPPASFLPAVALAATGLDAKLPVDYTRSRLARC